MAKQVNNALFASRYFHNHFIGPTALGLRQNVECFIANTLRNSKWNLIVWSMEYGVRGRL